MKIIFLDTPAFAKQDMIDAFEAAICSSILLIMNVSTKHLRLHSMTLQNIIIMTLYSPLTIFPFYPTAVKNTAFLMYPTSMTAL